MSPARVHVEELLGGQIVADDSVAPAAFGAAKTAAGRRGHLEEDPLPVRTENREEHRNRPVAEALPDPVRPGLPHAIGRDDRTYVARLDVQ